MRQRLQFAIQGLAVLAVCVSLAPSTRAADWEWSLAPYLWGSGVSLDLDRNGDPVLGADLSFSDLLDKTEVAGMLHFEGRRNRIGFLLDALYLSLTDDAVLPGRPLLPAGTTVHSDFELGLYEVGAFYRLLDEGQILDLLAGARWVDFEQTHDITLPAPGALTTTASGSATYFDGFAGARYGRPLGERWDFLVRGDVGAGGTELTWNALGTVGVRFGATDKYTLRFGWRQTELEIDDEGRAGADIESDITLSGPIVGFVFKF